MQGLNSSGRRVYACDWPGNFRAFCKLLFISGLLAGLASCGGGISSPGSYTVGGTVSGLAGNGLVLQDNSADDYTVNADGAFTFTTSLADGSNFNVTVKTEPSGPVQTCLVIGGSGTISGADVTGVTVACTTNTYTISGSVSGLAGSGLVLQNNSSDNLSINGDGNFSFTTPVASGASYAVTVLTQPSGMSQTCTVNKGSGTVTNADISNVSIVCSTNTYKISGTVSGLAGNGLVLQNNSGDNLNMGTDGSFSFITPVASGAGYNVTVSAQPSGPSQTCTVNSGSGTVTSFDVGNVTVTCSTNSYTVGGTVSGLTGTGLVLQNNGGDDLGMAADGGFTFFTPVVSGTNYTVTVKTQPGGQVCSVSNGNGTVSSAAISNVSVLCVAAYSVGGTVRGIASGKSAVLKNNGSDDITVASDGSFNFPAKLVDATSYNVTINTLPAGEVCAETYGSDRIRSEDVSHISVICGTTPSGSFTSAASLNTGRSSHSATLLPNGKVLVAGGVITATAELYDLSTNSWSYAASMSAARYSHTATLLPNGKVLVAGGYNGSTYFSSAELYDPATDTWSSAGNMSVARLHHTATLLRNGKVLVVGGTYGLGLTNIAELYDPATNSWSSAGTVATARYMHTATLLANGKVLVAAGATGTPAIASAELYDPATNTWSSTGSLAAARADSTANMLPSGKVLVTGGFNSSLGSGTSSLIGNAELYDPATGTWSSTGNLHDPSNGHTAVLMPDGKVLITGGNNTVTYLQRAEVYDPATNSWTLTGNMATARAHHSATLLENGHLLVVGGATFVTSAEMY